MRNYYKIAENYHRNWPIDLLRGVLVLIGSSGHFAYIMSYSGIETLHWTHFSAILAYNIPYGIAVFSAVSGFLITSMLLKHSEGDLSAVHVPKFYLQRFTRIMPGLILLCILNLLLCALSYPEFELQYFDWQTILSHVFTFRANILFPDQNNHLWAWGVLWSLAIEEVFYLLFPIICVLLRSQKKVMIFLILIIFYGPYCRLHAPSAFSSIRLYFGCFDLIAFGCLAAFLSQTELFLSKSGKPFRPKVWIGIGLFLMIGTYFAGPWTLNNVCGPTFIALGTFMYLIGVTYNQKNTLQKNDSFFMSAFKKLILPVCVLGLLSYELYIYHVLIFLLFKPVIVQMGHAIGWSWLFSNTWMFGLEGLTAVFGWFSFFYLFNPLRKKIISQWGPKIDFWTYVLVPQFFYKCITTKNLEQSSYRKV